MSDAAPMDALPKRAPSALSIELQLFVVVFLTTALANIVTMPVGLIIARTAGPTSMAGLFVGTLLSVVATFVVAPLAVLKWVPPRIERQLLERIQRDDAFLPESSTYELAHVSPASVVVPALLSLGIGAVNALAGMAVSVVFFIPGALLLNFAFVYHRIPNCRRSIKYAAFYLGSYFMTTAALFGKGDPSDFSVLMWLISPISTMTVFAVMRRRIRPDAPLDRSEPSTRRAFSWYRWAMSNGPNRGAMMAMWTILRCIPLFGDFFWSARICSKERLSRAPVLFLRSFANPNAARLLSEAVAPAISRVAVLAALVHPSQTRAALNRRTHDAWSPVTFGVGNDRWQEWFAQQLRGATAVVVDASVPSESTRWELDTALRILGRDRVAVLVPESGADVPAGSLVFRFDTGSPGRLCPALMDWIDWVQRANLERRPVAQVAAA